MKSIAGKTVVGYTIISPLIGELTNILEKFNEEGSSNFFQLSQKIFLFFASGNLYLAALYLNHHCWPSTMMSQGWDWSIVWWRSITVKPMRFHELKVGIQTHLDGAAKYQCFQWKLFQIQNVSI